MPERLNVADALSSVGEADLKKLAPVAHLLDIGQPAFGTGLRPHRTRSGQGAEFLDFRSYRPGEDIRRLDWRVSARRGRPYVRTYHDELSSDWQLCLDRSASMGVPGADKWALAVQLAAAFAYLLLHTGNRVSLVQFSNRIDDLCPLGRGRLQYVRIANQLRGSEADSFGGGSVLSTTTKAEESRPQNPCRPDPLAVRDGGERIRNQGYKGRRNRRADHCQDRRGPRSTFRTPTFATRP